MTHEDPSGAPPPASHPAPSEGTTTGSGYPQGGYPLGGTADGQPHLSEYLRLIVKRRWVVLAVFLAIAVPGVIFSVTGPPVYEARARIVVDQDMPEMSAIRSGASQQQTDEIQTHAQILRSRATARRAVRDLKLWEDAAFIADNTPSWRNPGVAVNRAVGAITGLFTSDPEEPAGDAADEPADSAGLADALLSRVTVSPVPLSRLIDIRYTSGDPRLSAAAANALARVYIQQDLEARFESAQTASTWLDAQLSEQRKRVEDSLAKLQSYLESRNASSLGDRQQNVVAQKLVELNSAVTRAKTDRIAKEEAYNRLTAIQQNQAALDTFPAILSNVFIQQLKSQLAQLQQERTLLAEKYGERHPEMVRVNSAIQVGEARLAGEIAKVVESVRNEYLAAQANERSLMTAYEQQRREALALGRRSIDFAALEREAQSNQQVYDSLLQQAKQAGMVGEIRRSMIRVVDPAEVPAVPVGPRRAQNALIVLLGGAVFGVGIGLGLEAFSSKIKSPEEIRSALQIEFLGIVPTVVDKVIGSLRPLMSDVLSPGFREAFLRLRANVVLAMPQEGSKTLMVTSTGPREGKTVVAANLAVALARAGHAVLLVDADMRKPRVHDLFGKNLDAGLSNVLQQQASIASAIRDTTTPGLRIMTAGAPPDNPSELLASSRFTQLLGSLREGFQWILIDTPPILAVADASAVAHETGHVMFVVGTDMTAREAAQTAVSELQRTGARMVGAVLNKVNLVRDGYYYSRYYKPEYEAYYLKRKAAAKSSVTGLTDRG